MHGGGISSPAENKAGLLQREVLGLNIIKVEAVAQQDKGKHPALQQQRRRLQSASAGLKKGWDTVPGGRRRGAAARDPLQVGKSVTFL